MKNEIKYTIIYIFMPLFWGVLLYLFFRSEKLLVFDWLKQVGLYDPINFIRSDLQKIGNKLPEWIIFSLPNALWTYSILSFINLIWRKEQKIQIILLLSISTFIICIEFLQAAKLVQGTFCWSDLILVFLLISLFFLQNKKLLTFKSPENENFIP